MTEVKTENIQLKGIVKQVYKKSGRAIHDYNMLKDRDRILVGVSGGKDSLSLLRVLVLRKKYIPIDFSLKVCCVDMGLSQEQKRWLEDFFQELNVEYVIKKLDLEKKELNCFWCSWNRRKILFQTAREFDCTKVALAHHLDDLAETVLLNLFSKAEVSAMKPKLDLFQGKLTLIRPFVYLEEKELLSFSSELGILNKDWSCPNDSYSKRAVLKEKIRQLKKDFPNIKKNIFNALKQENIRQEYLV